MSLAEVYPPARGSLVRLRAEAADAAAGHPPNREAIQEALAIDWAFKDKVAAYDLIGRVETEHGALHEYYNGEVFRLLSARGEYRRCRRWMADPAHELDLAAELFEFERTSESHERIRERAGDRFVDRAIELAVVLLGAGDTAGADEIVRGARRHLDHPRLARALDEALRILEEKPPVGT